MALTTRIAGKLSIVFNQVRIGDSTETTIYSDRKAISNKAIYNSSLKCQVTCDIKKVLVEFMILRTCKRIYNVTFNNPIKEYNILFLVLLSNGI
jgi:hypothetical protein